jgi:hypothetical protein
MFYNLGVHESLTALGATASQNLATTLGCHTGAETDFANALNLGRLPSHLHGYLSSHLKRY